MEGLTNVSLELNQIEIINMLDNVIKEIKDLKSVILLVFGFVIGYLILRDFINNIFKSL